MKTTAQQPRTSQAVKAKVNKQDSVSSILQRYKDKTAQLQTAEEEELLQGKFETVQRMQLDEEEPLQRKPNDTGLPDNLKSGIENLSGYNMDDVKVHYNSSQPVTLQAHAYAQGTDIHVAPGQEKHLPHEAWHVVQQKQGRVKPTMQMKGNVNVNDDVGLEKEADVMGAKAMQLKAYSYTPLLHSKTTNNTAQLATSIQYGGLVPFRFAKGAVDVTGNVGTRMKAHLDPRFPETGTDTSGSDAFNGLFDALQANTNSTWVRGHLLNHDLGGIAHYNNLFPITTAANGEHYHEVEKIVKHWVGKKCEVDYEVVAAKTGGADTPDGTFTCVASVSNDPTPAQTYAGKVINKTIESKSTLTDDNRQFANGSTKATRKYSRVVHNSGNNTFRDTYKGTLAKDARWDHNGGIAGTNNVTVANAFAAAAAVIPAPALASADELNAVNTIPTGDLEVDSNEFEFDDLAEILLDGDVPAAYNQLLDGMGNIFGLRDEAIFIYALKNAESIEQFILMYQHLIQ